MAATLATLGYGTLLKISRNGSGANTTVAEITEISGPNGTRARVDATHMESPNSRVEKLRGLIDEGEVEVTANFIPGDASQELIDDSFEDATTALPDEFQIVSPASGETATFSGWVGDRGRTYPVQDKMVRTFTIVVTGPVVFT